MIVRAKRCRGFGQFLQSCQPRVIRRETREARKIEVNGSIAGRASDCGCEGRIGFPDMAQHQMRSTQIVVDHRL